MVTITDRTEVGAFEDRLVYSACISKDWARHNRVLTWDAFRHPNDWFCHTYHNITSPSEIKTHPELFAKNPAHQPDETHLFLCPSNPENIRRACVKMREVMLKYPEKKYFSISEPDCGIGTNDIGGSYEYYCHCDRCMKIIKSHGASIAPHLELINAVARSVADRYPKQMVDFILYSFQKPPKKLQDGTERQYVGVRKQSLCLHPKIPTYIEKLRCRNRRTPTSLI